MPIANNVTTHHEIPVNSHNDCAFPASIHNGRQSVRGRCRRNSYQHCWRRFRRSRVPPTTPTTLRTARRNEPGSGTGTAVWISKLSTKKSPAKFEPKFKGVVNIELTTTTPTAPTVAEFLRIQLQLWSFQLLTPQIYNIPAGIPRYGIPPAWCIPQRIASWECSLKF